MLLSDKYNHLIKLFQENFLESSECIYQTEQISPKEIDLEIVKSWPKFNFDYKTLKMLSKGLFPKKVFDIF